MNRDEQEMPAQQRHETGDPVVAPTFAADFGSYAKHKCLPENGAIAFEPADISHEEATAVPGAGMMALHFLRKGHSQSVRGSGR